MNPLYILKSQCAMCHVHYYTLHDVSRVTAHSVTCTKMKNEGMMKFIFKNSVEN